MTGLPDFTVWELIKLPFVLLWDFIKDFIKGE